MVLWKVDMLAQASLVGDDLGQALLIIGVVLAVVFGLLFLLAWLEPPRPRTARSRRASAPPTTAPNAARAPRRLREPVTPPYVGAARSDRRGSA
jgi:hypothetical protein